MNKRNIVIALLTIFGLSSCNTKEKETVITGDVFPFYFVCCDHRKAIDEGILEPILNEDGTYKYETMIPLSHSHSFDSVEMYEKLPKTEECLAHQDEHNDDYIYYKYDTDDRFYCYEGVATGYKAKYFYY